MRTYTCWMTMIVLAFRAKMIFLHQVIGGELQDRLIPVPYSKNTTDQAVSKPTLIFRSCLPWIASCTESDLQMVKDNTD